MAKHCNIPCLWNIGVVLMTLRGYGPEEVETEELRRPRKLRVLGTGCCRMTNGLRVPAEVTTSCTFVSIDTVPDLSLQAEFESLVQNLPIPGTRALVWGRQTLISTAWCCPKVVFGMGSASGWPSQEDEWMGTRAQGEAWFVSQSPVVTTVDLRDVRGASGSLPGEGGGTRSGPIKICFWKWHGAN